jgi:hypothetical protein
MRDTRDAHKIWGGGGEISLKETACNLGIRMQVLKPSKISWVLGLKWGIMMPFLIQYVVLFYKT